MAKLVSAPNLLVLEGEVDLYETVKRVGHTNAQWFYFSEQLRLRFLLYECVTFPSCSHFEFPRI